MTTTRIVVDAPGGSRTCQVYRRNVKVTKGRDTLQFTYCNPEKVPPRPQRMFRVYARCCKTPICSAFWRDLPVMGLYAANFMTATGHLAVQPDSKTLVWDDGDHGGHFLPAPEYRINCEFAQATPGIPPPQGDYGFPVGCHLLFVWRNYVVGPTVRVPRDFHMPADENVIMIA